MSFCQSRLLLLGCSRRKTSDAGLVAAVERYDGPAFRVLRRYLRQRPANTPDIWLLSAAYGLIPESQTIPDYDCPMTRSRAHELQPAVDAALRGLLARGRYIDMMVCAGADYVQLVHDALDGFGGTLTFATGPSGFRLARLYDWLHGAPPPSIASSDTVRVAPKLRGIMVCLTSEQARDTARAALLANSGLSDRYQAWFVEIDGRRVAPKWLVSQLTGLAPGRFGTDEARRLLTQLDFVVERA